MGAQKKYETIRVENHERVTTITLNRPKKKNALNPTMSEEMLHVLNWLRYDEATDVLVITGAGDSFCAGMDLKECFIDLQDRPVEWDRMQTTAQEWRGAKLRMFPRPTIAAVNGWCFGGGIPIVAACDLAIAAEEAVFGISEINFGHIPAGPVTKVVGEWMRPRDALYHIMTGENFDGRRAADMGLVNYAVPGSSLREEVGKLADRLKSKNPVALRAAKELFKMSLNMVYDDAVSVAMTKVREVTHLQQGEWMKEGVGQFFAGDFRPGLETYRRPDAAKE
jgi:trans-feruloyl-CoA hydratase/vanillin synthase